MITEGKLCDECDFDLDGIGHERWFRRALLGQQPIEYRPINPELEDDRQERLRLQAHERRDLNAKFERNLSFYEELDEEFENLGQFQMQTTRFVAIHRAIQQMSYMPRKRTRSSSTPSETE